MELYCWSRVLLFFESSQVYDIVSIVLVVSRRNRVQDLYVSVCVWYYNMEVVINAVT